MDWASVTFIGLLMFGLGLKGGVMWASIGEERLKKVKARSDAYRDLAQQALSQTRYWQERAVIAEGELKDQDEFPDWIAGN